MTISRARASSASPRAELAVAIDFDSFYREHFRSILASAIAVTSDIGAAEDLTQEAFVAARRNWARISTYDRPDAWVRRVVLNLATSRWRRLARETRALARLRRRPSDPVVPPVPDPALWAAVAALPKRQRQVVVLRIIEDRSIAEVAEILDCGPETVRTHLRRAKASLADRLSEENP